MVVNWDVSGVGMFDSEPLVAPGRQNFGQGAIYRLKLTNIPGRGGVELYPTLEVGPATPRTDAYLAHNAIPVRFTEEDLDQVQSGNFVTKVIYLPDPEFQELALAGAETLVSTRLDPGVDPIVEADRRGAILAIIRVGNKDLQVPGAPNGGVVPASYNDAALDAQAAYDPDSGMVTPVGHHHRLGGPSPDCPPGVPMGQPPMVPPNPGYPADAIGSVPPNAISTVTYPQWGMPMSGTPIGLPGPPHIPLGVPAGLQKHVIKNKTKMHIPEPVKNFKMTVKQHPGYSYPRPVSRVHINEHTVTAPTDAHNPWHNKHKRMYHQHHGDCYDGYCE
jgi:hypothetical protein